MKPKPKKKQPRKKRLVDEPFYDAEKWGGWVMHTEGVLHQFQFSEPGPIQSKRGQWVRVKFIEVKP